jgi:sulfur carrier protein ThiS
MTDVVIAQHPFGVDARQITVPGGLTIAEIVERAEIPAVYRPYIVASVDGHAVPSDWWAHVRPKTGVVLRAVPQGGGGDKDVTRSVLLIGVSIASAGVAAAAASAGYGAFAQGALGAVTSLVGRQLINEVAPPARPNDRGGGISDEAPTFSIQGARNKLNPYGVVPRVYGTHRVVPPYAAKPFTEVDGDDQYLRLLFVWGYGPLLLDNVRIGETAIEDYEDVEIESVQGFSGDGVPRLYSDTVDEQSLSIQLDESDGFQTRTTNSGADELSIDITFPNGLFRLNSDGSTSSLTVQVSIEFAVKDSNNWLAGGPKSVSSQTATVPTAESGDNSDAAFTVKARQRHNVMIDRGDGSVRFASGANTGGFGASPEAPPPPLWGYKVAEVTSVSDGTLENLVNVSNPSGVTGFNVTQGTNSDDIDVASGSIPATIIVTTEATRNPVRRNMRFRVPAGDEGKQFDVRLRRDTADRTDNTEVDTVVWSKLRAIENQSPVNMDGVALTALRIRATDQLNGIIDQFNGVVSSILPDKDSGPNSFVSSVSTTAASAFRDVLTGDANEYAVSTSRVDDDKLLEWAQFSIDNELDFWFVFDKETTVADALDKIAASARASKTLVDGKWSVTIDQKQDTPKALVTPRNARNMSMERRYVDKIHAIRARFPNRDADYQTDEIIVYNDDYNADGSGGKTAATRFERMDFPGLTSEKEIYRTARYFLAVDELRPETYTFDMDIEYLAFKRGDRIQYADDAVLISSGYGRVKATVQDTNSDTTEFTLDGEINLTGGDDIVARYRQADGTVQERDLVDPGTNTTTDTFTFDTPVSSANAPAVDDLVVIGVSTEETTPLLVQSIRPTDDFNAKITAKNYDSAVYDANSEAIPAFDPRITTSSEYVLERPPQPTVENIRSDETALTYGPDGTLVNRIVVEVTVPSNNEQRDAAFVQLRYRKSGSEGQFESVTAETTQGIVAARDVDTGVDYELQVRSLTRDGVASSYVVAANAHTVIGKTTKPPDPDTFDVVVQADGTRELTFTLVNAPPDLAGFDIRFISGSSTDYDAMETLTPQGRLVFSPFETNQIPSGLHSFGVKAVDTLGNYSENALFIEQDLPNPRLAGVLAQRKEKALGWPGTLNSMFEDTDEVLRAVAASDGQWSDTGPDWSSAGPTWFAWTNRESPVSYETPEIDLGSDANFTPRITVSATGTVTKEMKTGTDADGSVTGSYTSLDDVEGARYVQIKVTITGTTPELASMTTLIDGEVEITGREDIDTSSESASWFNRIAAGHFQVAANDQTGGITRASITAIQSITSRHWWSLENKTSTVNGNPAAEFKVYDETDTLADVTVDVELKGPKKV